MSYDVVIIGSGPGGYSAAVRAGQFGLKVALVEKSPKLGGTCLHVGCVPTKALLHSAGVWEYFLHPEENGISCENPRLNYPSVVDRKGKIVSKHAKGIEFLMKKNKVDVIAGYGRLLGGGKVEVTNNGQTTVIETKKVIIATGSEARMLPNMKPQSPRIVTNVEILELTTVPKSIGIIGAGAVGVEFGSIFKRFGSDVTIFEMLPAWCPLKTKKSPRNSNAPSRKPASVAKPGPK